VIPLVLYVIGKYTPENNKPSKNANNKTDSTQANDIEQKMREWAGEAGNLHKASVRTWLNSSIAIDGIRLVIGLLRLLEPTILSFRGNLIN
jgi:hypothetical protein